MFLYVKRGNVKCELMQSRFTLHAPEYSHGVACHLGDVPGEAYGGDEKKRVEGMVGREVAQELDKACVGTTHIEEGSHDEGDENYSARQAPPS